jgi:hypothetical protein
LRKPTAPSLGMACENCPLSPSAQTTRTYRPVFYLLYHRSDPADPRRSLAAYPSRLLRLPHLRSSCLSSGVRAAVVRGRGSPMTTSSRPGIDARGHKPGRPRVLVLDVRVRVLLLAPSPSTDCSMNGGSGETLRSIVLRWLMDDLGPVLRRPRGERALAGVDLPICQALASARPPRRQALRSQLRRTFPGLCISGIKDRGKRRRKQFVGKRSITPVSTCLLGHVYDSTQ